MQQLFILAHRPNSVGGWLTQAVLLPGLPPSCRLGPRVPLRSVGYLGYVPVMMAAVQEERSNWACVIYANISFGKASHVTELQVRGREE